MPDQPTPSADYVCGAGHHHRTLRTAVACDEEDGEMTDEAAEYVDVDPDPRDLVRQLRVALGWADVALPISPKQAWEECLAEVQRLVRMDQL